MENNKLVVINNDYKKNIIIENNGNSTNNYLVVANDINKEINILIEEIICRDINSSTNVVVISNKNNKINLEINTKITQHNINKNINVLVYGFDNSYTNVKTHIFVPDDISNSFACQNIIGLLLSDKSKIQGHPNLSINSQNCNAEHSLKIGALDKEEIFYLQTKGFSLEQAKKIIISNYLNIIIDRLDKDQQNYCKQLLIKEGF